MKKVRIISDGTSVGSKVIDAETEEELQGVVAVDVQVRAMEATTATVTFWRPEVDVIAEVAEES